MVLLSADQNPYGIYPGPGAESDYDPYEMFGVYNLVQFDEQQNGIYKHIKFPDRFSLKKGNLTGGNGGWWVSKTLDNLQP